MAEETKVTDTNTKTQLSLAAALFFSPLVQHMLTANTRDITDQDKDFIRGYIRFGYVTILFWVITISAGVLNYLFPLSILSVTYTVSIFILVFLLLISIVSILSDISLLRWGDRSLQNYTIEGNKKDIIFKYLPIYNIYLRYTSHTFEKPNRRIKESILLRTIFLLLSMSGSVFLTSCIVILIVLRVASLMSDIDFLNTSTKQWLNRLFFKNPEEMIGYVSWFLVYLIKSLVHIFAPIQAYTLTEEITKEKSAYGRIIDIQNTNRNIIIEYILWIFLTIWLLYIAKVDFTVRTYYAWLSLLFARYLIMAIQLKHLPHFPLAREILLFIRGIGKLFTKKLFIHNQ